MEIKEILRTAIQEWIVPELDKLHLENARIQTTLELTNKRLDDMQAQLIDQSRRIDETNQRIDKVRDDLLMRIDETNKRIDDTNQRIDKIHDDLLVRLDQTNERIDKVRDDLLLRIDETNQRIDKVHTDALIHLNQTNQRIDSFNIDLGKYKAELQNTITSQADRLTQRLDRLHEWVTHGQSGYAELELRVTKLEATVQELGRRIAA